MAAGDSSVGIAGIEIGEMPQHAHGLSLPAGCRYFDVKLFEAEGGPREPRIDGIFSFPVIIRVFCETCGPQQPIAERSPVRFASKILDGVRNAEDAHFEAPEVFVRRRNARPWRRARGRSPTLCTRIDVVFRGRGVGIDGCSADGMDGTRRHTYHAKNDEDPLHEVALPWIARRAAYEIRRREERRSKLFKFDKLLGSLH